ncbi:DAW1-like protein [Mya arenaria]|uniref:DAW1-like protein n=1 Tax=Mya arenaria TaxID=6604 RepID=A0ABY7E0I7_MYAAR|nr:DAW1-like protein [Mya arenaria]
MASSSRADFSPRISTVWNNQPEEALVKVLANLEDEAEANVDLVGTCECRVGVQYLLERSHDWRFWPLGIWKLKGHQMVQPQYAFGSPTATPIEPTGGPEPACGRSQARKTQWGAVWDLKQYESEANKKVCTNPPPVIRPTGGPEPACGRSQARKTQWGAVWDLKQYESEANKKVCTNPPPVIRYSTGLLGAPNTGTLAIDTLSVSHKNRPLLTPMQVKRQNLSCSQVGRHILMKEEQVTFFILFQQQEQVAQSTEDGRLYLGFAAVSLGFLDGCFDHKLVELHTLGIILEYEQGGHMKTKTDVDAVVDEIARKEALITASKTDQVRKLIGRLQEKLALKDDHHFYLFKRDVFHFRDKIATGSFDKTCKLWSFESGKCYHTFRGHTAEIVCLSFNPPSTMIATGSMDTTAKLWDIQTGQEVASLNGHSAEIISLSFNSSGSQLITGSFDHTVMVWDVNSGKRIHTLIGHKAEISSAQFNYDCSLIATGSMDKTCKIWETNHGTCIGTLRGHEDEVLDVSFDMTGQYLLTASADGTARCYNATTHTLISKFEGHEGEISKITFNPQGTSVLTASSDKTARLWDPENGECKQILEGHTDEIFSCAFNYEGNTIITGSKDNTCRIWR